MGPQGKYFRPAFSTRLLQHLTVKMARRQARSNGMVGDTLVAAAYVALVAAWSFLIPFNGAPDEVTHFFLLEYIYKFHALPVPGVDPVWPFVGLLSGAVFRSYDIWYQGLPFLHVLGAAVFAKGFSFAFPPREQFMAARSFNWALAGIFMFSLLRALRLVELPRGQARAIALLFAAIPQVTFVFAYFNHDAFGLTAVALVLYAYLIVIKQDAYNRTNVLFFGAACGFLVLAKPYHYPALAFFLCLWLFLKLSSRSSLVWSHYAQAVVAALFVSLPMLLVTYLHFGDVTGSSEMNRYLSIHPHIIKACYVFCGKAMIDWLSLRWWLGSTYISFFGNFGLMDIQLPGILYIAWFFPLVEAFFIVGVIYVGKRIYSPDVARESAFEWGFVVLTMLMLVGTASMSLAVSQIASPQAQGRYLFGVIPLLACCTSLFAADCSSREHPGLERAKLLALPPGRLNSARIIRVDAVLFALAAFMIGVNAYAAIFVLAPATSGVDRYSRILVEFLGLAKR
jgi:hypothetical protein